MYEDRAFESLLLWGDGPLEWGTAVLPGVFFYAD
jgi:hypothetical protein